MDDESIEEKEKMSKSILLPLALFVAGFVLLAVLAIAPILLPEARPFYRKAFQRVLARARTSFSRNAS